MRDPHDNSTLDLVEQAKQPLSAAERQRRHREKMKREREEGRRFALDLQARDVALLRVALKGCRGRQDAGELLRRLPDVAVEGGAGDGPAMPVAWEAHSIYQLERGYEAPSGYRQTPNGQAEVDALVRSGDVVWTNYDSGPFLVKEVKRFDCQAEGLQGLRSYTLVMKSLDGRGANCWINELVAVDGRLLKLFANNADEVFVAGGAGVERELPVDVEALRAAVKLERRMAPAGTVPSFDELVSSLLPYPERQLLYWKRRNRNTDMAIDAEKEYADNPEKRAAWLTQHKELADVTRRYQRLLEVALELYELADIRRRLPRLSTMDGFIKEYRRYSESYASGRSAEGEEWARRRFDRVGKGPVLSPREAAQIEARHKEQLDDAYKALKDEREIADRYGRKYHLADEEVRKLRARVEGLERENSMVVAERAAAFAANDELRERLEKIGG